MKCPRLLPRWSCRETRFLLWWVALWGGVMMCTMGITFSATLTLLRQSEVLQFLWPQWIFYLAMVPALYVFARSALVLPATAVDAKAGLAWSWELTRGNGWRLALLVGLLPMAIRLLSSALAGENPGGLLAFALTCIHNVVLVVEIAILSVSYRHLTSGETSLQA